MVFIRIWFACKIYKFILSGCGEGKPTKNKQGDMEESPKNKNEIYNKIKSRYGTKQQGVQRKQVNSHHNGLDCTGLMTVR